MGLTAVNALAFLTLRARSQVIRVRAECVALNFHKCVLKVFVKPDKPQRGCIISERLKCLQRIEFPYCYGAKCRASVLKHIKMLELYLNTSISKLFFYCCTKKVTHSG